MADINYAANFELMESWLAHKWREVGAIRKEYTEICEVINSGRGKPGSITLTERQLTALRTRKSQIERNLEEFHQQHNIEILAREVSVEEIL